MGISGQASRNTDTKHHDADLTRRGKISRRPAAENRCDSRREHHAVCIHSQAESIPGRVLCMPFQKYEYATGFSVCRRTAFYRETAESPGICDTVIESVPSRRARTSKATHQVETRCALSRRRCIRERFLAGGHQLKLAHYLNKLSKPLIWFDCF